MATIQRTNRVRLTNGDELSLPTEGDADRFARQMESEGVDHAMRAMLEAAFLAGVQWADDSNEGETFRRADHEEAASDYARGARQG